MTPRRSPADPYSEHLDEPPAWDEPCGGCSDPDCDFDCDGDYGDFGEGPDEIEPGMLL